MKQLSTHAYYPEVRIPPPAHIRTCVIHISASCNQHNGRGQSWRPYHEVVFHLYSGSQAATE